MDTVLVYVCAIVLRLARFNTLLDDEDAPAYHPVLRRGPHPPRPSWYCCRWARTGSGWWTSGTAVGIWMVVVAALAVSRVPNSRRPRPPRCRRVRWRAAAGQGSR